MNRAAFASQAFGLNALVVGFAMALVPGFLLGLLRVPMPDDLFVRVWGLEIAVLGFYYVAAARADDRAFFASSVRGRLGFSAAIVALVVLISAPWQVLIVAIFDSLGAVWTHVALRRDDVATTANA